MMSCSLMLQHQRSKVLLIVVILTLIVTLILMHVTSLSVECPHIWGVKDIYNDAAYSNIPGYSVDCKKLISGDHTVTEKSIGFNYCKRKTASVDSITYSRLAQNCNEFIKTLGYDQHRITNKEKDFPIAFTILAYENVEQVEHLLRAIYRPQNVYCIHIDGKSPPELFLAFQDIAKCFPNVIVPKVQINVFYSEPTIVEAELLCLRNLWRHNIKWKYFINLVGTDFPLKTNLEMVEILTALNGSNSIDGNKDIVPSKWVNYIWRGSRTNIPKTKVPHGFVLHKGTAHIVASRNFVDYVLHDEKAIDFRVWMSDTKIPDEMFFNTLHYAATNRTGKSVARYKLWYSKEVACSGKWVHQVCNIGPAELPVVTRVEYLFVNKVKPSISSVAYQCLEQWYWNKTKAGFS